MAITQCHHRVYQPLQVSHDPPNTLPSIHSPWMMSVFSLKGGGWSAKDWMAHISIIQCDQVVPPPHTHTTRKVDAPTHHRGLGDPIWWLNHLNFLPLPPCILPHRKECHLDHWHGVGVAPTPPPPINTPRTSLSTHDTLEETSLS
jgi:hypothetical protein